MGALPAHDWVLVPIIPVTLKEIERMAREQRFVLRKFDINDRSQVRGMGVYCTRCELPYERMTPTERLGCRAVDDGEG